VLPLVIFFSAFEYIKDFFLLYFRGYTLVKREDPLQEKSATDQTPTQEGEGGSDKPIIDDKKTVRTD
jgi:hypothetical protein